jgi:DNA-binding PadR family transcriptional regulator
MKRKQIRLTTTSYAVMSLLKMLGEATPYELKQALERSIENFWPVPHTTFYDEPARLAQAGYLSERQERGGRRRKRYALTQVGTDALGEWARTPGAGPPQYRDEGMLKVFAGADPQSVYAGRGDWHRAKLTELEGYLETLRALPEELHREEWRGAEATLVAGIDYQHLMIDMIERLVERPASEREAAQATTREAAQAATGKAAQAATGKAAQAATGVPATPASG